MDEIEAQEFLLVFGEMNGWTRLELSEIEEALDLWKKKLLKHDKEGGL